MSVELQHEVEDSLSWVMETRVEVGMHGARGESSCGGTKEARGGGGGVEEVSMS